MEEKVEKKKKKVKKNKEVEKLEMEKAEINDKLLRLTAEFQNYIKRSQDEMQKLLKYSNEEIVIELLPVIDNFERALKMDDENKNDEVSKFLEGFAIIHQNLVDTLKRFEIKEIECLNKPFDSKYHEAVLTDNNDNFEKGVILEVLQKGYTLKDKVIRPAMVKVNE